MQWLPRGYSGERAIEVKRSRFIAALARADDEDAARTFIAEVRARYPDARHHCSAFRIDLPDAQPLERSSDDGEPSGTAGTPMLDVLRGAEVSQAVVVVARYFGGVLLGTGGLVRAYSAAVSEVLAAAGRVRPVVWPRYAVRVPHSDFGRLQADLIAAGVSIVGGEFSSEVSLRVAAGEAVDVPAIVARSTRGLGTAIPDGAVLIEEEISPGSAPA